MYSQTSATPESSEPSMPLPTRDEQRQRDAAARRNLEAMRERKLLHKQLTEVWNEPGEPRYSRQ